MVHFTLNEISIVHRHKTEDHCSIPFQITVIFSYVVDLASFQETTGQAIPFPYLQEPWSCLDPDV